MDKYCSTCGTELIVADTATYCPFCTIIKKKPMKTFFVRWKNGLEERLPGTSITNALVIARYDATAIKNLDYYTVDDYLAKMHIIAPDAKLRSNSEKTSLFSIEYLFHGKWYTSHYNNNNKNFFTSCKEAEDYMKDNKGFLPLRVQEYAKV